MQTLAEDTTTAVDRCLNAQVKWLQTGESVNLFRKSLNDYGILKAEEKGRFTGYMIELDAAYQGALHP